MGRYAPIRFALGLGWAGMFIGLVGSLSLVGTAGATAILTCKFTGNVSTVTLSGCSNRAATGGQGTMQTRNDTTIAWANGKTTSIAWSATQVTQDENESLSCPSGPNNSELKISGNVTADTTGSIAVGSALVAEVCFGSSGSLTTEPGTKFSIR